MKWFALVSLIAMVLIRIFAGSDVTLVTGWRIRWTFLGSLLLFVLFAAGTAMVAITHQIAWLATSNEPMYSATIPPFGGNPIFPSSTKNFKFLGNAVVEVASMPPNPVQNPARSCLNRSPYGFGGPRNAGGVQFVMADGSVRFISDRVSRDVLKALSTPNGGDDVDVGVLQPPR